LISRVILGLTFANIAAVAGACGTKGNAIDGTIRGRSYSVKSAIAYRVPGIVLDSHLYFTGVLLTNASIDCRTTSDQISYKNLQVASIGIASNYAVDGGVPPGTFHIGPLGFGLTGPQAAASAAFASTDSSCNPSAAQTRSGSVTLSNVNGPIEGSFDVVLDSSDHVTGSFSATECTGVPLQFDVGLWGGDGGIANCH